MLSAESFSKARPMTQARETESAPLLALCSTRALYMGELRKNTTSTGKITKKKKPGIFGKFETVGTKFFL